MNKLLNIYKPKGITSHDVVDKVRKKYPGEKVGHGGTLDPMAEGVLIIGVGKATKKLGEISKLDKEYLAEITFGLSSRTDDLDSDNIEFVEAPEINRQKIKEKLANFEGKIVQRVTLFSATHYKGEKLYKRARRGKDIPYHKLPKKEVEITDIELIEFNKKGYEYENKKLPLAKIRVECSSGTYIRSIARDLGKKLGTSAILVGLVRARVGEYKIDSSQKLE